MEYKPCSWVEGDVRDLFHERSIADHGWSACLGFRAFSDAYFIRRELAKEVPVIFLPAIRT
jgi:hypothetical protein